MKRFSRTDKRYLFSAAGAVLSYIIISSVLVLLLVSRKIGLPFHNIKMPSDAWAAALRLLPILGIAFLMMGWLVSAKQPLFQTFKWKRFSAWFFAGVIISLGYSINILLFKKTSLNGPAFWPPLLVLCLINAFSEEIIFRHVFYSLFEKTFKLPLLANVFQSTLYALPHIIYGSGRFVFYAFCYGLLMGIIKKRNSDSLTPCIICHFIIDLGAIGAPVL